MSNKRAALLVVNPSRSEAIEAATILVDLLSNANFELFTTTDLSIEGVSNCSIETLPVVEVAVVLGGDGTILRGAELTRTLNIPLLGINIGHVGFMAEVTRPEISEVAKSVIDKSYVLDSRMVLAYEVVRAGIVINSGWALFEFSPRKIRASKFISPVAYFFTHEFRAALRSCNALNRSGSASKEER